MARLPKNLDALTALLLYENVVASGETPLFQLRRKPVHGGGHLQKIGACERHLTNAVSGRATNAGGYLYQLKLCGNPYSPVRLVDVVSVRGTPHAKRCYYCARERQKP